MAKGNDGNYLQHSVELALAVSLAQLDRDGRLHIMLTHGMGPTEPTGAVPNGQTKKALHGALQLAAAPPHHGEPAVVTAYRKTNASLQAYPNSGELIASVVGRHKLSGGITEVERMKHSQLLERWSGSRVMPVLGSWRQSMVGTGVHTFSSRLRTDSPWLLSMDPMTYSETGSQDDDKLYRADFERIVGALRPFAESKIPGAAAIFVYAVRPETQPLFWSFADDIAEKSGMHAFSCWLTHQGGNRNLAAILSVGLTFPATLPPPRVNAGR